KTALCLLPPPPPQQLGGNPERPVAEGRPLGPRASAAGAVLAVAAGLKPALLYDCGVAGAEQLRDYLGRLREAGLAAGRLHLLSVAGSVLVLHPGRAARRLEAVLQAQPAPFVDVSVARAQPELCGTLAAHTIRGHLSALLAHLKAAETAAGPISCSEVCSADWNLCTVFGVLLGYPVAYTFTVEDGFENCLALTPLRVFTIRASCHRIRDDLTVQIYSFSIPENLYPEMKEVVDAWCDNLKDSFSTQDDFADLCISSEVVTLTAVAL
uniref:Chromosome 1 open reading frame 74 n=1 Tax=Dromaius novaehollandiae TaxID=8790 RepID=A0A8C4K4U5_DRONO